MAKNIDYAKTCILKVTQREAAGLDTAIMGGASFLRLGGSVGAEARA